MKQETRRRHRTATASAALTLAVLAGGCAEPADRTADRVRRAAATGENASASERVSDYSASEALAGSSWRLVEFQSMDDATGTVVPKDPSRYTMRLNEDGTVVMRLDCNRATGTWSAEPGDDGASGRFEFGPLAVTRALCPPPSLGESIAAQAEYIRSYVRRYGKLYLALMADAGIYVWEPDPDAPSTQDVPRAPDEGGPRNWEVSNASEDAELREQPSNAASLVGSFAPGTLLDNLGCRSGENEIWCDVQPLGGGPRGYVLANRLEPAVSPDGSVAVGPDDSALRAGQGEFDATGQIPCAQRAGQPMTECAFGVARAGGGYATVVITRPDGASRAIFFRMGRPIGADTSEADSGTFEASREGDLHFVRVGSERYEIPAAAVLGG